MNLGQLSEVINGLIKVHGETMDAVFLYQYASGRTNIGAVTKYEVRPPNKNHGMKGAVTFRIGTARGELET